MSEGKKTYRTISEEELKNYLKGKLSPSQAHELERRVLDSDLETDALDGWEKYPADQLSDDLSILRTRLAAKEKPVSFPWMKVAAVAALLILAGYGIWLVTDRLSQPDLVAAKEEQNTLPEQEQNPEEAAESLASEDTLVEEDILEAGSEVAQNKTQETQPEKKAEEFVALAEEPVEPVDDLEVEFDGEETIAFAEPPQVESITEDLEVIDVAIPEPEAQSNQLTISGDQSFRRSGAVSRSARYESDRLGSKKIYGKVTSEEDSEPLPGVTVSLKGSTKGVITDMDGNYSIDAGEGETLVYNFIGFSPSEREISNQDSVNVALHLDLLALEEVVVVGYGTQDSGIDIVYQQATPVGGMKDFKTYIEENKTYPESAMANDVSGVVKLRLAISSSGEITDIEVKRSIGYGCDAEAIRLIREGPKWNAAIKDDQPIESEVTVKVRFP